jgi:hypothetical protein
MAKILNNLSTNYSLYYNLLDFFKRILSNHPSVGHVTQGMIEDFDTREFPKYPIANVLVLESRIIGTTTIYNIQLILADKIKNKNNESENEFNEQIVPFYGVDDTVDIHSNTLGIINDIVSYLERGTTAFMIETDTEILLTPFQDRFNNGLAGWVAEFALVTHNNRNICLFNLGGE